jgi:chromosomal replication initiation ATPase DnaA
VSRRFAIENSGSWQSPVIAAVCEVMGVSERVLRSHRRTATIALARHLAMALLTQIHPERTQEEVAGTFDLGHANVRHAVARIDAMVHQDPVFRAKVSRVMARLSAMGAARCGGSRTRADLAASAP